jgi:hypothetical protein
MAKKLDARELLNDVLNLIAEDIERIEQTSIEAQLDSELSARLVRYSDALLKITKDADTQQDAEKAKLANMSKEELEARAREYLNRNKK